MATPFNKVRHIKLLRQLAGCSLKEAKDMVEAIQRDVVRSAPTPPEVVDDLRHERNRNDKLARENMRLRHNLAVIKKITEGV